MKFGTETSLGDTWAVMPRALDGYGRQLMSSKPASMEQHRRTKAQEHEDALAFVSARSMDQLPGSLMTGVVDGVAVIPVMGMIRPRPSYSFYYRASTNLVSLTHDLELALESSAVHSILFNIDSPGGLVAGVDEFAEKIYQARGMKPMKAYVTDLIASAAYWIGSATDEIVMSRTGEAGSIGTIVSFTDWSEYDKKLGIRDVVIVNEDSPKKGTDPASSEGQKQIKDRLDAIAEVFLTTVARNRGVEREEVVAKFGQGDLIVGEAAQAVGLVNRLGSFDSLLSEMSETKTIGGVSMTTETKAPTANEKPISVELIAGEYPAIAQHFIDQGKAEGNKEGLEAGAKAERERIQGIESTFTQPGVAAIVNEHKFNPEMTAESIGMKVLAAMQSGDLDQSAMLESDSPAPVDADSGGQADASSPEASKIKEEKESARKAAESVNQRNKR